jgi:hypothetical protein
VDPKQLVANGERLGEVLAVVLVGVMAGACSSRSSHGAADAAPEGRLGTTPNLIVNGDAESAPGSSGGNVVVAAIPGWTPSGNANVVTYGAHGGYPTTSDPGPVERGSNFFSGGPDDPLSVFTQHIDLSHYSAFITRGNVSLTLSAYLGGYAEQDDNAVLKVAFLNGSADAGAGSLPLGVVTLGPVLAADRNEQTGLFARATTGMVPAGTTSIDLQLTMTRTKGSANDGYADNLLLTLTDEPADAGTTPDAPVDASVDASTGGDAADAPPPPGDGAAGPAGEAGVVPPRSDAAIYLDDQFARFLAGQPADLNGDGIPDTFVEALPGGGTRTRRDLNQDGVNDVVTDVDSAGNSTTSIDDDGDGKVDRTDTTQVGPPFVRVERWDENHDGLFERRRTSTTDAIADTIHVVVEVDETAAHTSTMLSDETVDLIEGAGAVDRACMNLPVVDPDTDGPAREDHIRIPTHESVPSGYCNMKEAMKLSAAFDCARDQMHKNCLDNLDSNVTRRIEDGLKEHGLRVTCGLCLGVVQAATEVDGSISSFNHLHLATLSDPQLCVAATHELMHMAGYAGPKTHDDDHDDKIYACSRTCNGCTDWPPVGAGISTSQGRDCATCAETLPNKMKCGSKPKLVATSCLPQYTVCRSGLLAYKCPDCKAKQWATCDDITFADTGFTCCQACDKPSDPNFAPCSDQPKECTMKPSYCP